TKHARNSHWSDSGMFRPKGNVACYILTGGGDLRRWHDAERANYACETEGAGKTFHSRLLWFDDLRGGKIIRPVRCLLKFPGCRNHPSEAVRNAGLNLAQNYLARKPTQPR